jgi:hypothetical protein
LLSALFGAAFAQAPGEVHGVMKLSFGHVRTPDGKLRSVKGLEIPWVARPVPVMNASNPSTKKKPRGGKTIFEDFVESTVYYCMSTGGQNPLWYSGESFQMPSAADDVTLLATGAGRPWKTLGVGYKIGEWQICLLRWLAYETSTAGRGAGVSALDPYPPVVDFGGEFFFDPFRFPLIETMAYFIEFDVSVVGASVAEEHMYFASQIRDPVLTGDGPFRPDVWVAFAGPHLPQIGSSEQTFWYDQDLSPPVGIYDETEVEVFSANGEPPQPGENYNMALKITIDSSATLATLTPLGYTVVTGRYLSGDIGSLQFDDQDYLRIDNQDFDTDSAYPIEVHVRGRSPVANIFSFRFDMQHSVSAEGHWAEISLFRYASNQWFVVFNGPLPTTDTSFSFIAGGNPQQYVNQTTRDVLARIRYYPVNAEVSLFDARLDLVNWVVGRP